MKLLGILRASALCLLAIGFHGPRGVFCSNLKVDPSNESFTVEVSEISENPDDSTVESSSQPSAPATKPGLVFESSTWDDSMLASSVLFINEFCRGIQGDTFKGNTSDANIMELSWPCLSLSSYTKFLSELATVIYGPGAVAGRKIPKNFYEGILEPKDFKVYTKWLRENLPKIWKSYKKMLEESAKLTEEQIKTETSMGPLKYGFVYKSSKRWKWFVWLDLHDILGGIASLLQLFHIQVGKILENFEGSTV
ncbi:secreted antigen 3 [Babesia divergens]|uniref:Secreted antigen 3 n=1 Tax=Babesia divergens TaxID=32595 RepID=A0AAD9GD31_BABDI|nr:secreted antigen 3 [Babesia divergens]